MGMGSLSRPQRFILFSLGQCRLHCKKVLAGKPLQVSMSKAAFIELARAAGFVEKKERALYKNLEALETKRLVYYDEHKNLVLTKKGWRAYKKLRAELKPYIAVSKLLESQGVLRYSTKIKTVLSNL